MNVYEETSLTNAELPSEWRKISVLDDLMSFLQNNWNQRHEFFDDESRESKQQFLRLTARNGVRTGKYIGTIVFNGAQLDIYPKMFRDSHECNEVGHHSQQHMLNNILHWVSYCNRFSYPYINLKTELKDVDNLRDFFITLYIAYVKSTVEKGLYHRYVEKTEDNRMLRGRFNIKDYLTVKIPNGTYDRYNCTFSEFEYDNLLNQIIKYVLRILYNETSVSNQKTIRRILTTMVEVSDVKCHPKDCDSIRLGRERKQYGIILSMSKIFLLNRESGFAMDNNESFCFLFPTDYLFEGFISGFIKEIVEPNGGHVSLQESLSHLVDKVMFQGKEYGPLMTLRHDILLEFEDKLFILDAKYKRTSPYAGVDAGLAKKLSEEVSQSDLYQICEYARKKRSENKNVSDVYLLYPMYRKDNIEEDFPVLVSNDKTGGIRIHIIRLPFIFEENQKNTIESLKAVISKLFPEILSA